MEQNNKRTLIAFFSRPGQNYKNGAIVELKQGNTALAAKMLADLTGADEFEIVPTTAYPNDYYACTDAAKNELRSNARPPLKENGDVAAYDTVLLLYPNWWGTMPMPLRTFLDAHDFSGKTILPLCTHEGSGMGQSEADLKRLLPPARIGRGLAIRGSEVAAARERMRAWLIAEHLL